MKKLVLALSVVAFVGGPALADPIEDREAIMKERRDLVGQIAPIVKGEKPFDAAAVMAALEGLKANAEKFDVEALFPAGSDQGDTAASPKIWEDMAGFKAVAGDYRAAVEAAVAAAPQDVEALKTHFGAITKNCGTCHETYRLKKG